ncbi:membrane-bound lytic murein transglycosylase D [Pedobacter cryoconitis]|uniref:Membrane-bound lytic murein transglycosylase D n=1 Tax=Pedobacter cryoconitis TaxID=188932 RepID=A0A7W9DMC8_9SPHI|nr:lytic transglycosylase domain-containing protein [Pedobacter cryoconitis]MBB5624187.1 membrane-bound lytic murein transglycosylase D [Pedobacter cryoconitis]MBB5647432.1 membrane-bound lytic murein transglycosylase D [Pedobacter cryoconitis]
MKRNVLILSFCVLILAAFNSSAQQKINKLDSISPISFLSTTYTGDTTAVPEVLENPLFYNYNFTYKKRLDSIQKQIPLPYNESVQRYIDIYSSRKDMMGKMLGLSEYYFPIFENALKAYDVPMELKFLPIIESSMNSHAISRVGATGLWQFMFSTAKDYGLGMDNFVDERKDPIQASYAAAAYFKDAYKNLGDWLLAIAAYNCGTGNVNRAIAKAHSRDFWAIRPFLPQETRNYVPAFIAAIYVMNCPDKHQIKAQKSLFAIKTDTIQVSRFVSLTELAEALAMEEGDLCTLNPSYKKKIVNGSEDQPKRIIIPKVSLANFAEIYEVLNNHTVETSTRVILASNDDRRLHKKHKEAGQSSAQVRYHKVGAGQNLIAIANQYNVEVQDLRVWNNLKGSTIVPGQRLIVAQKSGHARETESRSGKKYISYKAKGKSGSRITDRL